MQIYTPGSCKGVGCRPGVLMCGWLSKEGPHTLSRAFPSRRFCVLVDARLEYYEERQVQLNPAADGSSGIELNPWNLVVHVLEPHDQGVAVGDIAIAIDGVELGDRPLNDVLSAQVQRLGIAHKLTVLRPKGEVPLAGAQVECIGKDRMQITPSPRELLTPRPPYVFIANRPDARDDWFEAVEQCIQQLPVE
jgi:hypothetical protein